MRALRLEMLADSPLAYLETLADAAARPHDEYAARVARAATGTALAQFVAEATAGPAQQRPAGPAQRRTAGRFVAHAGAHAASDDPAVTVLYAVYVSPPWRGQGLLGALVNAVADWSRAAGRPQLLLEVVVGNDRALRAYQRLGFTDTGVRLPHPTLPDLTELQMRRPA
ncbi:GNAT family N-acetyltransferase [Solwaraspora sp. WMMA2056]|uniref:GNAT family N-acetyltransferase n=1 Tax=Solwaraspora sp. WMMA2056 TaxID=3015161 RepID=UPI00259AEBA2|nr:GNAT family N-acetyltransferase [Solwaraspora sp. WMMA2056]WJK44223.1 GNAT family N-acetyltransferase [Solwaraspora sp. WMMA2056]